MNKTEGAEQYVIKSPLKRWPGEVAVVHPDEFRGSHWNVWRKCVDNHEKQETLPRILAYAGLEFIEQTGGSFDIKGVTLAEARGWEKKPEEEMTKLISWLGREFQQYVQAVTDPKE